MSASSSSSDESSDYDSDTSPMGDEYDEGDGRSDQGDMPEGEEAVVTTEEFVLSDDAAIGEEEEDMPPPDYIKHDGVDVVFAPSTWIANPMHRVILNEGDAAIVARIAAAWKSSVGDAGRNAGLAKVTRVACDVIGIPTGSEKLSPSESGSTLVSVPDDGESTDDEPQEITAFKLLDIISESPDSDEVNVILRNKLMVTPVLYPMRDVGNTKALTIYAREGDSAVYADDLIKRDGEVHSHIGMMLPTSTGLKYLTIGISSPSNQMQYRSVTGSVYEHVDGKRIVHYVMLMFDRENSLDLVVQYSRIVTNKTRDSADGFIRYVDFESDSSKRGDFSGTSHHMHGHGAHSGTLKEREAALTTQMAKDILAAEESIPINENSSPSEQLQRLGDIQEKKHAIKAKYEKDLEELLKSKGTTEELEATSWGHGHHPHHYGHRRVTTSPYSFSQTHAHFFTKWARKLGGKIKGMLGFGPTARSAFVPYQLRRAAALAELSSNVTEKFELAADYYMKTLVEARRIGALPVTVKYFTVGSANALRDQRDPKEAAAFLLDLGEGDHGYTMLDMDLEKKYKLPTGKKRDVIEVYVADVADRAFPGFKEKFVITPSTLGEKDINGDIHAMSILTDNIAVLLSFNVVNGVITHMVFVYVPPEPKEKKG